MDNAQKDTAQQGRRLSPKAKQYAVLGVIGTVFLGLVFGSVALWERQPDLAAPPQKKEPVAKNIAAPGSQVDPRDVWMAQSSQKLMELDQAVQSVKALLANRDNQQVTALKADSTLPPLPPLPPPTAAVQTPAPATAPAPVPAPAPKPGAEAAAPKPAAEPAKDRAADRTAAASVAVFEVSPAAPRAESQNEQGKTYIPSGSFMRSVLLGGLDAPTGGQAQNNPWPALLRIQDNAFLPNRYRARVRECFMLASGYGDISSERAYLRLESLSCVLANGEVVDTPAKGYIVGEDGKAGMRGRLVSKQGQVLANALLTGIISGIGQGIQQSATTYTTTVLGTVGTVEPGKQIQAGIGAGIGRALDRLSQYYINLAEKMFPVIEVDAGRVVDVVLTKGVTLALNTADEGDYTEIWKRGRQIMGRALEPFD